MKTIAFAAFLGISPETLLIIVVGGLLLFGGKKIPEMMKGMGQGVREFKKGLSTDDDENDDEAKAKGSEKKTAKEEAA